LVMVASSGSNGSAPAAEQVAIVTRDDLKKFVRTEAVELLNMLRRARLAPGADPVDVARVIAPVLAQLCKLGESVFGEPEPPSVRARPNLISMAIYRGEGALPPLIDADPAEEQPSA